MRALMILLAELAGLCGCALGRDRNRALERHEIEIGIGDLVILNRSHGEKRVFIQRSRQPIDPQPTRVGRRAALGPIPERGA